MDSELLPARIADAQSLCTKTSSPKFLGFLTPAETAAAVDCLKNADCSYRFFGGYDGAERVILALLPDWCDEVQFPIIPFTFKYRECDTLTHRDFLGALMALGITRESVGDILVERGRAVAFISRDISKYVASQTQKVGSVGVNVTEGCTFPLPSMSKKAAFTDTVASLRLDGVVAALCGFSRNAAAEHIQNGEVSVNSVCCQKTTRVVAAGDVITVRHKGRFEIDNTDQLSKKGRIILKYNKYI